MLVGETTAIGNVAMTVVLENIDWNERQHVQLKFTFVLHWFCLI